jgi:hypothetical protein
MHADVILRSRVSHVLSQNRTCTLRYASGSPGIQVQSAGRIQPQPKLDHTETAGPYLKQRESTDYRHFRKFQSRVGEKFSFVEKEFGPIVEAE